MKSEVVLEFLGKNFSEEDLYAQAKKIYTEAGYSASSVKSIKLYVQPENNIVYFVVNDDFKGDFLL